MLMNVPVDTVTQSSTIRVIQRLDYVLEGVYQAIGKSTVRKVIKHKTYISNFENNLK